MLLIRNSFYPNTYGADAVQIRTDLNKNALGGTSSAANFVAYQDNDDLGSGLANQNQKNNTLP
jgi:hypothetical protein